MHISIVSSNMFVYPAVEPKYECVFFILSLFLFKQLPNAIWFARATNVRRIEANKSESELLRMHSLSIDTLWSEEKCAESNGFDVVLNLKWSTGLNCDTNYAFEFLVCFSLSTSSLKLLDFIYSGFSRLLQTGMINYYLFIYFIFILWIFTNGICQFYRNIIFAAH